MKKKSKIEIEKAVIKKKEKFNKALSCALVGLSLLFTSSSLLAQNTANIQQQKNNVKIINSINVGDNVNTAYESLLRTGNPDLSFIRDHISNSKYIFKNQENLIINFKSSELTEEHKLCINYAIEQLNYINEQTYTNFPKLNINYSPTSLDLINPTSVTVKIVNNLDGYNAVGLTSSPFMVTTNGLQSAFSEIKLKHELLSDPIYLSHVLTHELLHSLYGIGDQYLIEKEENFANVFPSIMNTSDMHSFLTLNDIKMIDYLSWTDELTENQIENVKKFYENYEKENIESNGKNFRNSIYKKLFEKNLITEKKILEKLKTTYNLDIDIEKETIENISSERYYHTNISKACVIYVQQSKDVQQSSFTHISPEKIESISFKIGHIGNDFGYIKNYQSIKGEQYKNFTIFDDKFYFEYKDNIYYLKIDNNFSFSVNRFEPYTNNVSEKDYIYELNQQEELYKNCENIKTSSYDEILQNVLYNKIQLDYKNNIFKESFSINENEYILDKNFGDTEFVYNFTIDDRDYYQLVCENINGVNTYSIKNSITDKKLQSLKNMDGILIGDNMAFMRIDNKIIGIVIDEDKLVKEKNGLYKEIIQFNDNYENNFENELLF